MEREIFKRRAMSKMKPIFFLIFSECLAKFNAIYLVLIKFYSFLLHSPKKKNFLVVSKKIHKNESSGKKNK